MSKPKILEEKPLTMAEAKELLKKIEKRDGELGFRAKNTKEFLDESVKLSAGQAQELREKLEKLNVPRLKEEHIVKIIDVMPETPEEFKVLIQGYPVTISQENAKKIADVVKEFVK